jgi:hypothetical protein
VDASVRSDELLLPQPLCRHIRALEHRLDVSGVNLLLGAELQDRLGEFVIDCFQVLLVARHLAVLDAHESHVSLSRVERSEHLLRGLRVEVVQFGVLVLERLAVASLVALLSEIDAAVVQASRRS